MRRWLVGIVGIGAVVWLWLRPAPEVAAVPVAVAERVDGHQPAVQARPEATVAAEPEWSVAVASVERDCGLGMRSVCEGPDCVSLLSVPPLDGVGGWLALSRSSPALVAAVVAGELGLPDDALACRAAVRSLGDRRILARVHDGGEVWCLTAGDGPGRALCDAATGGVLDFAGGEDRVVELRPPGT
jgi:hypothetical protein